MTEDSYIINVYPDRIVIMGSVPIPDFLALMKFAERLGFDALRCKREENENFSFVRSESKEFN